MKQDFFFDFETRSRLSLPDVGAVKYSLHQSTQASLLAYAFGPHTHVKVWDCLNEPIPSDIREVMSNTEEYNFIAWNVFFDLNIWKNVLPKMFPLALMNKIPLSNIHDVAALSMQFRTGAALETAAIMHRLPHGKSKEGAAIMRKQMRPDKTGEFPTLNPHEMQLFKNYAKVDVELMREIYYSLPKLPEVERYCFEWTLRRNLKGLRLDMPLVQLLQHLVEYITPSLEAEFFNITKLKMRSPKMIQWMAQYYPHIKSLDAENMEELYHDLTPVPSHVRRAIEIKYLIGSSSIVKLKVALQKGYHGRIYEILAYGKAQNKRWAGMGLQVQNFPRPDNDPIDKIDFDLNQLDLCEAILKKAHTEGFKEPIKFVRNLLRRIFLPEEGEQLVAGDFSKIEPTVLFWLTGLGELSPKWYEELAASVFNKSVDEIDKDGEERQIGKMGNLLSGYGGGWASFQTNVKKQIGMVISEQLAKLTVYTYRKKYAPVVQAWADLDSAFRNAINGQTTRLFAGRVTISQGNYRGRKMVVIRMPSGGCLFYHNPRIVEEVVSKNKINYNIYYDADGGEGKIQAKKIYGGLICENVVSAIAREIMRAAMWRLESKGFDILNLVHDEIWASIKPEHFDEFIAVMSETPAWAEGMKIKAEGKFGVRYLK